MSGLLVGVDAGGLSSSLARKEAKRTSRRVISSLSVRWSASSLIEVKK